MKFIFILTLALYIGCTDSRDADNALSPSQKAIIQKLETHRNKEALATNSIQKDQLKEHYLDTLEKFIIDSLHYQMSNFKVTVKKIENVDIGNIKAFHANFIDQYYNEYWMEFDYPIKDDSSLQQNPAYILLKDLPENTETQLSFFYMGDIKWSSFLSNSVRLQVVPFPKNYNFDSARLSQTHLK